MQAIKVMDTVKLQYPIESMPTSTTEDRGVNPELTGPCSSRCSSDIGLRFAIEEKDVHQKHEKAEKVRERTDSLADEQCRPGKRSCMSSGLAKAVPKAGNFQIVIMRLPTDGSDDAMPLSLEDQVNMVKELGEAGYTKTIYGSDGVPIAMAESDGGRTTRTIMNTESDLGRRGPDQSIKSLLSTKSSVDMDS